MRSVLEGKFLIEMHFSAYIIISIGNILLNNFFHAQYRVKFHEQ